MPAPRVQIPQVLARMQMHYDTENSQESSEEGLRVYQLRAACERLAVDPREVAESGRRLRVAAS